MSNYTLQNSNTITVCTEMLAIINLKLIDTWPWLYISIIFSVALNYSCMINVIITIMVIFGQIISQIY